MDWRDDVCGGTATRSARPGRLFGLAQTAVTCVDAAIADFRRAREMGVPHTDSTWPHSQELLATHAAHLTTEERQDILRDNVTRVFGLPL